MKTLKQLAQDSIDVQNASNLLGVSKAFNLMLLDLKHYFPDHNDLYNHAITRVWVDKITSLSNIQFDSGNVSQAFDDVMNIIEDKE